MDNDVNYTNRLQMVYHSIRQKIFERVGCVQGLSVVIARNLGTESVRSFHNILTMRSLSRSKEQNISLSMQISGTWAENIDKVLTLVSPFHPAMACRKVGTLS